MLFPKLLSVDLFGFNVAFNTMYGYNRMDSLEGRKTVHTSWSRFSAVNFSWRSEQGQIKVTSKEGVIDSIRILDFIIHVSKV